MTKQEFTELTGINPTEEEFDKIHELYMATGVEMDKDSFCAAYKSCKDMTLVNALYHSLSSVVRVLKKELEKLKEERDRTEKERNNAKSDFENVWEKATDATDNILEVAEKTPNKDHAAFLESTAVSLVGQFNVCMAKLRKGYIMDDEERAFFYNQIGYLRIFKKEHSTE